MKYQFKFTALREVQQNNPQTGRKEVKKAVGFDVAEFDGKTTVQEFNKWFSDYEVSHKCKVLNITFSGNGQ